ncbi:adenine nucleotide alpha hydrolase family protein [Pseudodesulfovibrio piezophilus]|uniref:PP-loop domain protein n=1 Tax=Pseudodesulfovibrio piezophilus (strain DSM 21447 / JCM 15486 / C1TLV30) TaxID=1322246 RepID=M1WVI4_PSEP2|nr:hypothetical protein [Pseudodesulfovibrio piezophilus]CCH48483.1 conserved protein of unknown function [Pseudodesulfovibrio piezophilus C1TLV30]
MFRYTHKTCSRCHLQQDSYHKVMLNEDGVCSFCTQNLVAPKRNWEQLKNIFEEKIQQAKGKGEYDGLIMLSGGKDSAYMAHMLTRKYNMKLLGFIIDINFEYPETFENAATIAEKLDMPSVIFRQDPELMRQYYAFLFCNKTIHQEDCGQVCTFCGRFLIQTATDFARRMEIPLVFSGHNPDQIFLMGESIEDDPARLLTMEFNMEVVAEETERARKAWHQKEKTPQDRLFPSKIHAQGVELVFPFQHFRYQPEAMIETVKKELDWVPIKRFSKTYIASGCSLVKLWAYLAYSNNTNSYVDFEFSNQVREGVLSSDKVAQFYEQSDKGYEELDEIVMKLGIRNEIMQMLLERKGEKDGLYQYLTQTAHATQASPPEVQTHTQSTLTNRPPHKSDFFNP